MNYWRILGIEPTDEVAVIKKAYRQKLKSCRPDDDEDAFMKLREAYEYALDQASKGIEEQLYDDNYDEENDEDYNDDYEEFYQATPEQKTYYNWTARVNDLYKDYYRRNNVEEWKELLYNDVPYEFAYYQLCRNYMQQFLCNAEKIFLTYDVKMIINDFFSFSKKPLERAKADEERIMITELNRKLKLCENVRLEKLNPLELNGYEVDGFFYRFDMLVSEFKAGFDSASFKEIDALKCYPLFYLPLECLNIYCHWQEYSVEDKNKKIEDLIKAKEKYIPDSDEFEILLLKAMLVSDSKDYSLARKLLKELYMKVDTKDYLSIYLLSMCCKNMEMYFEAYMLVKQLTWLNPRSFMYEMAEEIYKLMDDSYNKMLGEGVEIDDLWHIHMCRMYLRSDKGAYALEVLKRVKDSSKYLYEYEVANVMCIFYEESVTVPTNIYIRGLTVDPEPPMEVIKAKHSFVVLENYPKDKLGNIEKLELRELQARYLFEQRRYRECDSLCNEILDEYPVSYPILTLRAYNDFNENTLGTNHRSTEYMDFTYLLYVMPQRSEIRLIVAQLFFFCGLYGDAASVFEPIQKIFPDHYRVYKLFELYGGKNMDKLLCEIEDLFKESMEREFDIPPVSKYRRLDLRNICFYGCNHSYHDFEEQERVKFYDVYSKLKDSSYNSPELYIDWIMLYQLLGKHDMAIEYINKKLENATEREKRRLYSRVVFLYNEYEDVEKCKGYVTEFEIVRQLGFIAQRKKDYELAAKYYEKAIKYNQGNIRLYNELGISYYNLGRYEDAADAYKMGIRKWDITGDTTDFSNCYVEAGTSYYKMGKYDEAIECMNKGKKYYYSKKILGRYYYVLGLCYEEKGERFEEKKREAYRKAVELRYCWPHLYRYTAEDYIQLGEYEQAIKTYELGLEFTGISGDYDKDEHWNFYYDIYSVYRYNIKDFEKGIEYLELMRKYTNGEYYKNEYWPHLGLMYHLLGDVENMKKAFLEALALNIPYPGIYGYLHRAYDDPEEKLEILLKGIELAGDDSVEYGPDSLYKDINNVYMELGDYHNAYLAGVNLVKKSEDRNLIIRGYEVVAIAALFLNRCDITYDAYCIVEEMVNEDGKEKPNGFTMNMLIAQYNLRKIGARDIFYDLVYEDYKENFDVIPDVFRAEYMATGAIDKELARRMRDELLSRKRKLKAKNVYEVLFELSAALGEVEDEEKYKKKVLKYTDEDDEEEYPMFAWSYIYKGDYKKALEFYEPHDECKSIETSPCAYAEYTFVREMCGIPCEKKNTHLSMDDLS